MFSNTFFFNILFISFFYFSYALPQSNQFFSPMINQPSFDNNRNFLIRQQIPQQNFPMNDRNNRLISSESLNSVSINKPIEILSNNQNPNRQVNSNFKPVRNFQKPNNQNRRSPQTLSQRKKDQLQSKINWGRCPQLQPSIDEKLKKAQVISKCLESTPVPENITRETIELHRELVAACALKEEGWFTNAITSNLIEEKHIPIKLNITNSGTSKNSTVLDKSSIVSESKIDTTVTSQNGTKIDNLNDKNNTLVDKNSTLADKNLGIQNLNKNETLLETKAALETDELYDEDLSTYSAIFTGQLTYNYAKAEYEIKAKKFEPDVESKVIQFHQNCKEEAQEKYNNPIQIIGQIQLYQACMDYFISEVCQIQVTTF